MGTTAPDFRCRRRAGKRGPRALLLLAALGLMGGCGEAAPVEGRAPTDAEVAGAAEEAASGYEDPWGRVYYRGYLAETLRGDVVEARAAYEEVLAQGSAVPAEIAARSALRLAELEALAGRRRKAIELVARASALGRDTLEIIERADRLQARLASVRAEGSEVRGPPLGAALEGVSAPAQSAFSEAEAALEHYYGLRLKPRLEALRASVRAKERATEAAVRAYEAVIELGQPPATVAAEFRAGSVYHDLAVSLMFDLPPELEPQAAARMRRTLRSRALGYLRKASAAYRRSIEAAEAAGAGAATDRWRVPAELGLRSVRDLLSGRE